VCCSCPCLLAGLTMLLPSELCRSDVLLGPYGCHCNMRLTAHSCCYSDALAMPNRLIALLLCHHSLALVTVCDSIAAHPHDQVAVGEPAHVRGSTSIDSWHRHIHDCCWVVFTASNQHAALPGRHMACCPVRHIAWGPRLAAYRPTAACHRQVLLGCCWRVIQSPRPTHSFFACSRARAWPKWNMSKMPEAQRSSVLVSRLSTCVASLSGALWYVGNQ
jgi:hypothetical protein